MSVRRLAAGAASVKSAHQHDVNGWVEKGCLTKTVQPGELGKIPEEETNSGTL